LNYNDPLSPFVKKEPIGELSGVTAKATFPLHLDPLMYFYLTPSPASGIRVVGRQTSNIVCPEANT